MTPENTNVVKSDESQGGNSAVDGSRRSLVKLGGSMAPIMMMLANKPVWGEGRILDLCTVSGFISHAQTGFVASGTTVQNKKDFTPQYQDASLVEWQQWASANNLSGLPFTTVEHWQQFYLDCSSVGWMPRSGTAL